MDPSSYKQVTTKRGVKYSYFVSRGDSDLAKPVLLFIHGFPSTSYDWRKQVAFFQKDGFGIIAPDCLGYGGTDKPLDPNMFKYSAMAADIIDILDAEHVDKPIVIGHDWGSVLTSRLASYYPDRFLAFAFLAVGYAPSGTGFEYEAFLDRTKKAVGRDIFGYWDFFKEDGAEQILQEHWDTFIGTLYPSDPALWLTHLCPRGAIKTAILEDNRPSPARYITEEDRKRIDSTIGKDGLGSALNWYKSTILCIVAEDDKQIPKSRFPIQQPVFYGGGKRDAVNVTALALTGMDKLCPNLTVREFDVGHWVQLEAADELNRELAAWIHGVLKAKL